MLRQTFTSEPVPYRDHNLLPGYVGFGPYNTFLVTAPRHYREQIYWVAGLFARRDTTANGNYTLNAVCVMSTYEWPSWGIMQFRWDAATGEYIDRIDRSSFGITLDSVKAGADDSLWAEYNGAIYAVDSQTWSLTTPSYPQTHWGGITQYAFALDPARDLAVVKTNLDPNDGISVHQLSTGARLRSMQVAGQVQDIFIEENGRAYVLATNGVLTLIDYLDMRVLGVMRQPNLPGSRSRRFAWDRQYRRILTLDVTAEESDGASTSCIRGYYPTPAAVALTQPIPLKAPRTGRTVQVLTRAYGDTGEPIAGLGMTVAASGPGSVAPALVSANGYGYARHTMTCTGAGTINYEVSAQS